MLVVNSETCSSSSAFSYDMNSFVKFAVRPVKKMKFILSEMDWLLTKMFKDFVAWFSQFKVPF